MRAWAQGAPIWQETHRYLEEAGLASAPTGLTPSPSADEAESQNNVEVDKEVHALVYGPASYQEDLLETVLLRAAQYPGPWDASPEPKKKKPSETPGKTPNEAAAFFESLLK